MSSENQNKRGGKRSGAGRKPGSGPLAEKTTVIRIPESQKLIIGDLLQAYARKVRLAQFKDNLDPVEEFDPLPPNRRFISLPLFESKVAAGFPSPANDHVEKRLSPDEYLIDQAETTFFVTIQGESMIEVGLMPGDKAVVNRDKSAEVGDIVLAMIDGEFTIKSLAKQKNGMPKLLSANSSDKYSPILITEAMQFEIWGVVTGSFRRFK